MLFVLQLGNAQEEKFKALFLYNFCKNIEWPESSQKDFEIGVIGNSSIIDELKTIAQKGKVGSQPITIQKYNSPGEIQNSKLVFIANSKKSLIADAVQTLSSKPILIVTENDGDFPAGVGIRFTTADGKLKFEISRKDSHKNGMKVSPALFSLGTEK